VLFAVNVFWVFQITTTLTLFLVAAVLPSTAFLASSRAIFKFFNLWVVMHVILALISIREGGRGSGSFLGDENDWALALNMAIPYAYFLGQSSSNTKLVRILYFSGLAVMLLAVINTGSRGGFIGLVVAIAGILYFSRRLMATA